MAYALASDLRARINKVSVTDDTVLTALLAAAETTINGFTNRPDGFLADTLATPRLYSGSGKPYLIIDECVEITLVEVLDSPTGTTYTSWAATDWIPFRGDPKDPNFNGLPYTGIMVNPSGDYSNFYSGSWGGWGWHRSSIGRGVPTERITAKWGYSVAGPADIKEACLMQAARWYKRFEGAMSDALASAELGTLLYRQVLDPDIAMILVRGRYVRPAIGRR